MTHEKLEQEKVDELVERFYSYLTKDAYYSTMFAERNVDIEQLKAQQKIFISRLVNENTPEDDPDGSEKVQKRHTFHTTPERAKIWLDNMKKAMNDMQLAPEIKDPLFAKMSFLMGKLLEK